VEVSFWLWIGSLFHFPLTLQDRAFYDNVHHLSYSDQWLFTKLGDISDCIAITFGQHTDLCSLSHTVQLCVWLRCWIVVCWYICGRWAHTVRSRNVSWWFWWLLPVTQKDLQLLGKSLMSDNCSFITPWLSLTNFCWVEKITLYYVCDSHWKSVFSWCGSAGF